MASISLEDMPQLVLEKITSFLNIKQLLTLEQVSRKLKYAIGAHFSITDHLIIGYLPEVEDNSGYDKATAKVKKCLDGFLNIIKRCGIRLRTIYVSYRVNNDSTSISNYNIYFHYIFASAEMSDNCPNVENIVVFPKMDIISSCFGMFHQQNILLELHVTEIYAKKIKLSKGETCKLRSIALCTSKETGMEDLYKRGLNLFSNLEQIAICHDLAETLVKFLPKFIKNGLKDLQICGFIDLRNAKKYCNIGKDLRTLRLTTLLVQNDDDISELNKLQVPTNLELGIEIHVDNWIAQLSENICNSIIECNDFKASDYSLISKLRNLKQFDIQNSEQLKAVAVGSLPDLIKIVNGYWVCSCYKTGVYNFLRNWFCSYHIPNMCDWQTFLPQLLINKGHQLVFINIITECRFSVDVVWKMLKHCNAAKCIKVRQSFADSQLTVTYEDVKAIFRLPYLQQFTFQSILTRSGEDDTFGLLSRLVSRAVRAHTHFQFKCDFPEFWIGVVDRIFL